MLTIAIPGEELFDEETQEFHTVEGYTLELEHSLVSLSKWESKFQKPFLGPEPKERAEMLAYIDAMILTPIYPANFWRSLSPENFQQINDYLESSQSATTFGEMPERKGRNEVITSELIYYWMVAFNIPFETERWHINRLFALIRICNLKNQKPKKMSKTEIAQRNRQLNAERRAKHNTAG